MSVPTGSPGPTHVEVTGPPDTGGRRWGTGRRTLVAIGIVAVLTMAGLALLRGTAADTPAAAHGGPTKAAGPRAAGPSTGSLDPGTLNVSTRSIDLGRTGVHADFDLATPGDLPAQFQVSSRARWLR